MEAAPCTVFRAQSVPACDASSKKRCYRRAIEIVDANFLQRRLVVPTLLCNRSHTLPFMQILVLPATNLRRTRFTQYRSIHQVTKTPRTACPLSESVFWCCERSPVYCWYSSNHKNVASGMVRASHTHMLVVTPSSPVGVRHGQLIHVRHHRLRKRGGLKGAHDRYIGGCEGYMLQKTLRAEFTWTAVRVPPAHYCNLYLKSIFGSKKRTIHAVGAHNLRLLKQSS